MDENSQSHSQGSVELLEGVEMVSGHVPKIDAPAMREEDLHPQYIEMHRSSPAGQLLPPDLIQSGQLHPHIVEEFNSHAVQEYYEHHILQEQLSEADRHLAELQAVEEPQNLSTPVSVVSDKPGIPSLVTSYIHTPTTTDVSDSHQIIMEPNGRNAKIFQQQQRLPPLASLPPLKKALTNSTIRSRYLRTTQSHHAMDGEVTSLAPMTASHHGLVGSETNVMVVDGPPMLVEDEQRLLDAEVAVALTEDPVAQKILQESATVRPGILSQDNQRLLAAQDANGISHSIATTTASHRLINTINGHQRALDAHPEQNSRFITPQEPSVVTSLSSARLLTPATQQTQTQTDIDDAEKLLDEESPEHQMLVQEQLIHVVLNQQAQEELGGVVPTPGQRVLVQGPGGHWTELDPASCEPESGDHDSRDNTAMVEITQEALRNIKQENVRVNLMVKNEEEEMHDNYGDNGVEMVDGMAENVADGSDGDGGVDDMNDSDDDVEGDMRSSRRSLPHKKRLSKKLRNPRKSLPSPRRTTHITSSKKGPSFSCEICSKVIPNQLKFFEHLKSHYEPVIQANLAAAQFAAATAGNGSLLQRASAVTKAASRDRSIDIQLKERREMLLQTPADHRDLDEQQIHQLELQQQHLIQHRQIQQRHSRFLEESANALRQRQLKGSEQYHHILQDKDHEHQQSNVISSHHLSVLPPVSTITGPITLTCNLCGKIFRRQKAYETHLSVAHPKQEEIEQFSDPEDMMEGIREVVEAGEESGDEGDSLVALTNLAPHSTEALHKHTGVWYRDDELSAAEADLRALQHAENVHEIGHHHLHNPHPHPSQQPVGHLEMVHACDLCGDAFHSKAKLAQHLRDEHMELRQKVIKKHPDNFDLSNSFENLDGFDMREKKTRRLACTQCDRVFNHRNSLVYHLRSHSGERPHRCEECGKCFFATSALKVHMRLHSGDKPYKCEFCGRNFRQWGDLKYHCTSLHSEDKQYQCEYCGKDFARKYSLIVHRRIHTGEKNYVCEFCHKQFRASSYLQNHRRIHTGEKPHRCEICNKPFRVRSDMKRHLNTHKKDRQREALAAAAEQAEKETNGTVHKIEEPDSLDGVEASNSGDHTQAVNSISLHELSNASAIVSIKEDADAVESILPDGVSASAVLPPTTSTFTSHTADDGLSYASGRDPLEIARSHSHGNNHSATQVFVWPVFHI